MIENKYVPKRKKSTHDDSRDETAQTQRLDVMLCFSRVRLTWSKL